MQKSELVNFGYTSKDIAAICSVDKSSVCRWKKNVPKKYQKSIFRALYERIISIEKFFDKEKVDIDKADFL